MNNDLKKPLNSLPTSPRGEPARNPFREEGPRITTYIVQINGRTELILEGELRGPEHGLGPGGVFTVVRVGSNVKAQAGDRAFLIALPDAPKTTAPNPARREQEKRERL